MKIKLKPYLIPVAIILLNYSARKSSGDTEVFSWIHLAIMVGIWPILRVSIANVIDVASKSKSETIVLDQINNEFEKEENNKNLNNTLKETFLEYSKSLYISEHVLS